MTEVERMVRSVMELAAGEADRCECADAGYRRAWLGLRDAAGLVVARGDWRAGAQGAPYPEWHREVVLEALRVVADRPRPAAGLLSGRLVDIMVDGHIAAQIRAEVMLLLLTDAQGVVVEVRGGELLAIPWARIHCIRARERACRECGCTDERACSDGCCWVEVDLCSACEERLEFEAGEDARAAGAGGTPAVREGATG